jgi:hypothetical protein
LLGSVNIFSANVHKKQNEERSTPTHSPEFQDLASIATPGSEALEVHGLCLLLTLLLPHRDHNSAGLKLCFKSIVMDLVYWVRLNNSLEALTISAKRSKG